MEIIDNRLYYGKRREHTSDTIVSNCLFYDSYTPELEGSFVFLSGFTSCTFLRNQFVRGVCSNNGVVRCNGNSRGVDLNCTMNCFSQCNSTVNYAFATFDGANTGSASITNVFTDNTASIGRSVFAAVGQWGGTVTTSRNNISAVVATLNICGNYVSFTSKCSVTYCHFSECTATQHGIYFNQDGNKTPEFVKFYKSNVVKLSTGSELFSVIKIAVADFADSLFRENSNVEVVTEGQVSATFSACTTDMDISVDGVVVIPSNDAAGTLNDIEQSLKCTYWRHHYTDRKKETFRFIFVTANLFKS